MQLSMPPAGQPIKSALPSIQFPKYAILLAGMFAGVSAVCAASIAYVGVTSKTRLDRKLAQDRLDQERRNLFLKTEQVARMLEGKLLRAKFELWNNAYSGDRKNFANIVNFATDAPLRPLPASEINQYRIPVPPQLSEIWDHFSFFDEQAVSSVRELTYRLQTLDEAITNLTIVATHPYTRQELFSSSMLADHYNEALRASQDVIAALTGHDVLPSGNEARR
ncbi:MAG: hypothetical protein H3C38_18445 [Rhodospirillales bacterium]|nr:hypothetical protein [Rhodospirillales bacterium]